MFTEWQLTGTWSAALGNGTWLGVVTMIEDPTFAFLKQGGGMISQARHQGRTQIRTLCEFIMDFEVFGLL